MNFWNTFFDAMVMPMRPSGDGPMSRLMRTEFRKDYDNAVRNRGYVSEEQAKTFVRNFHL